MPKYLISWTEEAWYNLTLEADSQQDALDIFHNSRYDFESIVYVGGELQDSVEVEEV